MRNRLRQSSCIGSYLDVYASASAALTDLFIIII